MKVEKTKISANLIVKPERTHFKHMLAKNPNYFGNIAESKLKPIIKIISDPSYETLTCVGYNPDTAEMKATFSINRSSGYSGNLCGLGSFEYVRFYLDFHDGAGFIDQGSVAVNVHDIPNNKDCNGKSIFPIQYVATLKKKTRKFSTCSSPSLPTLRAILSWSTDPPTASPNWTPVWGGRLDSDVQLKPTWLISLEHLEDLEIDLSQYFDIAKASPNLTTKQLKEVTGINIDEISSTKSNISLNDLILKYDKLKVPVTRTIYKKVSNMIKYPTSEITIMDKSILEKLKINIIPIIDEIIAFPFDTSKANVDFEELECVGLDYASESLVATIRIKKKTGFVGDLCDSGSKEFISFWVDWDNSCSWQYVNTVELKVHDIDMKGDSLSYSVSLPLDATFHRKLCTTPNVIRVRGVLSWNVAPSTIDPNKLEYYGNRVDSHVQIKPGLELNPGDVIPLFNIIGGIDVAHVNDLTGLTSSGAFFALNGIPVPTGAPFGGVIVLNGPSFPGYRYKIKITNLANGTVSYANDTFTVVGSLPHAPWVQYTTQTPDAGGYYPFLDVSKNTLNVLARFTPTTEDRFLIEMEVDTIPGAFSKIIQIDNSAPVIQLHVNDLGDCTHYAKGDTITGTFYVYDKYLHYWSFGSTWGTGTADPTGTTNTPALPGNSFSIATLVNSYPCGSISLYAVDKTIVNSQSVGHYTPASYNICLKEKK
ncbi:hypothetical protein [Flavobacterium adhaerens]|uniref:hypothetical protein n=1 Tax=Flavobacterium adhaerens TaxID=3149043 RepID=UPI0032B54328